MISIQDKKYFMKINKKNNYKIKNQLKIRLNKIIKN
jgi:hypothetical protein